MTDHLKKLRDGIAISIPRDDDGYTGRECPDDDCIGYFKIVFGTGLPDSTTCVCPYCGTTEDHDHFWTQDQLEYAHSAALEQISVAIHRDLKSMEFEVRPPRNSILGIGFSLRVEPRKPIPLHQYAEKELETRVDCEQCTLKYAIYGVFGYCPDCGEHNSLQILHANLALGRKILDAAKEVEAELRPKLLEKALENCVSAFDGWGRNMAERNADLAVDSTKAARVRFQNFRGLCAKLDDLWDFQHPLDANEFDLVNKVFQKRHLIAHRMGVVDQAYLDKSGDQTAMVGRKVAIDPSEVGTVTKLLEAFAESFEYHLAEMRNAGTRTTNR